MSVIRRVLQSLVVATALACAQPAAAQPPQPSQQDEFVPMSEVPPEEQLPAAPLVLAAYSFVWLAVFAYLLSIGRKLGRVDDEIARLETEMQRSARV